jgi:hypothetical protein
MGIIETIKMLTREEGIEEGIEKGKITFVNPCYKIQILIILRLPSFVMYPKN